MGGQRPGPYDRPMMGGPRGGFFGPGPGRGGALMDTMRSGGGYGGGKMEFCISAFRNSERQIIEMIIMLKSGFGVSRLALTLFIVK